MDLHSHTQTHIPRPTHTLTPVFLFVSARHQSQSLTLSLSLEKVRETTERKQERERREGGKVRERVCEWERDWDRERERQRERESESPLTGQCMANLDWGSGFCLWVMWSTSLLTTSAFSLFTSQLFSWCLLSPPLSLPLDSSHPAMIKGNQSFKCHSDGWAPQSIPSCHNWSLWPFPESVLCGITLWWSPLKGIGQSVCASCRNEDNERQQMLCFVSGTDPLWL